MTVEAAFAALVLFGILLLVSTLFSLQKDYQPSQKIIGYFSMDMLSSLQAQGAFDQIIRYHNDSILRSAAASLPSSLCMQVEIYSNNVSAKYLNYSYTSENCTTSMAVSKSSAYRTFSVMRNSSLVSFYWAKAIAYPRG